MRTSLLKLASYLEILLSTPSAWGCLVLMRAVNRSLVAAQGEDSVAAVACVILLALLCVAAHMVLPWLVQRDTRLCLERLYGREYGKRCEDCRLVCYLVAMIEMAALTLDSLMHITAAGAYHRLAILCLAAAIVRIIVLLLQLRLATSLRRLQNRRMCILRGAWIY